MFNVDKLEARLPAVAHVGHEPSVPAHEKPRAVLALS